MFRIEGFVEDKHLPKVLWALNGMVMNLSSVPVANATGKKGRVESLADGADILDALKAYLKKNKMKNLTAKGAKQFQLHVGRSEQGYSSLLKKAVDAGLLKKAGKGTKTGYTVAEGAR